MSSRPHTSEDVPSPLPEYSSDSDRLSLSESDSETVLKYSEVFLWVLCESVLDIVHQISR